MYQLVKIFTGQVFFSAQKNIQDKVALGRAFEALLLDVCQEYFLFFSHDPRRRSVSCFSCSESYHSRDHYCRGCPSVGSPSLTWPNTSTRMLLDVVPHPTSRSHPQVVAGRRGSSEVSQ